MKRILFIDNTAHHLHTQEHLYSKFPSLGYQVILCCPDDGNYFRKIAQTGYECISIKIDGKSTGVLKNLQVLWGIYNIFKAKRPDLIFSFTIKPNIYSAIIAKLLNMKVVPNITGLGYVFLKSGWVTKFVIWLYRFSFSNLEYILFQNHDDKQVFVDRNILAGKTRPIILPGDGVNLTKFPYVGYTNTDDNKITFLYIGRLLLDKGIGELVTAFKIVKQHYPEVRLKFIGNYFLANPSAISKAQMEIWQDNPGIEYLGMVDDVNAIITTCDCVVLPSYREGLPRAILEGSSMGKPVITTDTVGCRDTVDDNITGLLCKVRNSDDLADKMVQFIKFSRSEKEQMGRAGRRKMEQEFDQDIVTNQYVMISKSILG